MQCDFMKNSNPNPTGKEMLDRQRKAEELEYQHLCNYAPGKGDDTLDILHFWAVYQPDCIEAICFYLRYYAAGRKHEMPEGIIEKILDLYTPDTVRRRRQYIQSAAEKQVDAQVALLNLPEDEIEKQKEFLREQTRVLPSKRVRDKRKRLEIAMRYDLGRDYHKPDAREKRYLMDY